MGPGDGQERTMRKMREADCEDSETDSLSEIETEDDSGEKTGPEDGVDEVSQPTS